MLIASITLIVVLALAATPITYYLRTRRNPDKPPPSVNADTFKEWKE